MTLGVDTANGSPVVFGGRLLDQSELLVQALDGLRFVVGSHFYIWREGDGRMLEIIGHGLALLRALGSVKTSGAARRT